MANRTFLRQILTYGIGLSVIRIAVLWLLVYREWSHQQSIASLPLILLLYPEGLLLPGNFNWTVGRAIGFSGILVVGSFLLVTLVLLAIRALRV